MASSVDIDALLEDPKPRRAPPPEREISDEEPLWTWDHVLLLTAITLLAGVLRLYRIGEWSFWIDEVHTLRDAVLKTSEQFWASPQSRYPLGYLLVRWVAPLLPGSEEANYRLVFAFWGIASVPLLAAIVRRILGAGPAILGALVLALSPWHLYWSQNCRVYTLVAFFALASFGTFYLACEKGRGPWLLASLLFAGLASLCHPSAYFIVPAQVVYLVLLRTRFVEWPRRLDRRALRWLWVPLIAGAVLLLGTVLGAWTSYEETKGDIEATHSVTHLLNTTAYFVHVPVIVAALGGLILLWHRSRRACLFLGTMLLAPSFAMAIASFFVLTTAQYLFFLLPVWCMLAGYGIYELAQRIRFEGRLRLGVQAILAAVVMLDLAAQDHLYFHYRHGERPRWREAAEYVDRNRRPDDIVASINEPSMEWYLNPAQPMRRIYAPSGAQTKVVKLLASWTIKDLRTWVQEADAGKHRVWLVLTEPEFAQLDPTGEWNEWIRDRFHQVRRLPNWTGPKDMTILVYAYQPAEK